MGYYDNESEALEPSPTIDQPAGLFEAPEARDAENDLGDAVVVIGH